MFIVITGVSRGLGRALALAFIEAGHTVAGCGRSGEAIMDLRFDHPEPHDFSVLDVTQRTKVELWADRLIGTHGPPDFLINNAALMNNPAPLWKVPAEEFDRLMAVNVNGVVNVIRAFVPAMVERKQGVIVNLSSGWGHHGSAEVAPYCASKFAIEGLTQSLAEELPKGMAAIPLSPGVIDTDMLRQCWAEGASAHPKAEVWVKKAAPYILKLGPKDNGKSLRIG